MLKKVGNKAFCAKQRGKEVKKWTLKNEAYQ